MTVTIPREHSSRAGRSGPFLHRCAAPRWLSAGALDRQDPHLGALLPGWSLGWIRGLRFVDEQCNLCLARSVVIGFSDSRGIGGGWGVARVVVQCRACTIDLVWLRVGHQRHVRGGT